MTTEHGTNGGWTRRGVGVLAALALVGSWGCMAEAEYTPDIDSNPFLDDGLDDGKEDSGYANLRGVEVEVALEADIKATSSRIFESGPEQAQFAVTYMRTKLGYYLEILAEDATAPDRVEWLVDGSWLTRAQASSVDMSKLTHWRMRGVNVVAMDRAAQEIRAGQVLQAKVPLAPYTILADASNGCADPDNHISLDQSVYWYLWNPDRSDCRAQVVTMSLTVERVLPANPETYPEYDRLTADHRIDAVVLFAKLDDGAVANDQNWNNVTKLGKWLTEAGFREEANPPLGKRYSRVVGELTEVVDIYGPDLFESVADWAHLSNWQKAVSEHELVFYNGHSVLGTGMAFEEVRYPETYQIFQIASCLSYEYYVRPILAGKGGWENVDVLSNTEPTYFTENFPLTTTMLAKLFYGAEHQGNASWQDIMEAISRKLGHATFGVSGARDNCFSPEGSRCGAPPPPDPDKRRYENATAVAIPDNNATGVTATTSVPDSLTIRKLAVEVSITHPYVGDLEVTLAHGATTFKLWSRTGGSDDNINIAVTAAAFAGQNAQGDWTLTVKDRAARDTGTLNRVALVVTPDGAAPPPPAPPSGDRRYASTTPVSIPDNQPAGITSTIDVPDSITVGRLKVEVNVTHTYVGDLRIELSHAGVDATLWDREGSGTDNINRTFDVPAFDGRGASGTWTLKVSDEAGSDVGTLDNWALIVTPG